MVKKRKHKKKTRHNIFDSVFHTLVIKMPWLLIPLINYIYNMAIPLDTPIIQLRNEFYEKSGKLIIDSTFRILDRIFHFECQSRNDSTMSLRMFMYDAAVAMEHATLIDGEYYIDFPDSVVVYLRHNRNTPDEHFANVRFSDGTVVRYKTRVIKVQNFTSDEMFANKLLIFLPFYIMRYEKDFSTNIGDKQLHYILHEIEDIRDRLTDELADRTAVYYDIAELIIKISDHILREHSQTKERVRKIMSGEILELYSERIERISKEKLNEGLALGLSQGLSRGSRQRTEEIIANMLSSNYSDNEIINITGCHTDELIKIKQILTNQT